MIKFEIRNPKSETIPKFEFSNKRNDFLTTPSFGILVFRDLNLFRYSCFDIRIFVFIKSCVPLGQGVKIILEAEKNEFVQTRAEY